MSRAKIRTVVLIDLKSKRNPVLTVVLFNGLLCFLHGIASPLTFPSVSEQTVIMFLVFSQRCEVV